MAKASTHISLALAGLVFSIALGAVTMAMTVPETARFWQLSLVYVGVFFLVYSSAYLVGYSARVFLGSSGAKHDFVKAAARQGLLLALMAVVLLLLSAKGTLNFWSAGLLLVIFILIELYSQ